jgi:hypothetical protein
LRSPHLLRVEAGPEGFGSLLQALAAAGLRAGWLELRRPEPAAASLEAAAALGARRAVAVGGGRSVAVKPLRGEPVLRDLLREHFLGCALVLVVLVSLPEAEAPSAPLEAVPALFAEGEGWRVEPPGGVAAQRHDTAGLVAALRRPRPWG